MASSNAPVDDIYLPNAFELSSVSVVPVSTIPAVCGMIGVDAEPNVILWSIPQNSLAGDVFANRGVVIRKTQRLQRVYILIGTKVIGPVVFDESIPPNVSSPFTSDGTFEGLKEMPISFAVVTPCANSMSVTVGMRSSESGFNVPSVRSTGPRLSSVLNVSVSLRPTQKLA